MSSRIHSIEYNDLENCLYEQQWTTFYISIGGKWNQDTVNYKTITKSNASLQMIPRFLNTMCGDPNELTLVIIFDDFPKNQNTYHNIDIIQSMIQNKPHLHVYLVNKMMSSDVFNDCWSIMQPLLYERMVPPSRFSIVNYVKYMNTPNAKEKKTQKYPLLFIMLSRKTPNIVIAFMNGLGIVHIYTIIYVIIK